MSNAEKLPEVLAKHLRALTQELSELGVTKEHLLQAFAEETALAANQFATQLTPLETISLALKNKGVSFKAIAQRTKRSPQAISLILKNVAKKNITIPEPTSPFLIPFHIVSNRELAASENIVLYLHEHYSLPNATIARELGRDQRNTWALLQSAKRKRAEKRT